MASSSENLMNFESWMFRSAFADSWTEAFARDTESITKALQQSLSNNSETFTSDTTTTTTTATATATTTTNVSPLVSIVNHPAAVSSVSGSDDPETVPNRRRIVPVNGISAAGGGGKIAKRKSRASKRSTTTFIMADPANFRQMVQQVTGVRFGASNVTAAGGILKPEPQRPGSRLQGRLPTLESSAFLIDPFQQPEVSPSTTSALGGEGHVSFTPGPMMAGDGGAGLGFDSFASFPTLESWKVM